MAEKAGHFEKMAIPVLMFAVGVVGNITAIAVLSKTKRERKESAFYTLVCGLAVTDLLGTCLASPITIVNYFTKPLPENVALCEFHSFLLLFFGVAGLSIICAMSVERYLAISHPYSYQRWSIDQRAARYSLVAIYVGNVLFCCLPMLGLSKSVLQVHETWCFIDWRTENPLHAFYSFLYAGVSSLLIVVTVACNVAVCGTLLVMRRKTKTSLVPRESVRDRWTARTSGVEIQMMLLLIVTSAVVLVCSTPLVVRVFYNQITRQVNASLENDPDLTAIRIASANPILDPWVYILLRRTVLFKLLALLKRVVRGRSNSVVPGRPRAVRYLLAADKTHAAVELPFPETQEATNAHRVPTSPETDPEAGVRRSTLNPENSSLDLSKDEGCGGEIPKDNSLTKSVSNCQMTVLEIGYTFR